MKAGKVIIKKYENRRLYDAANSRYVNLEDVARMLREGTEVEAVDATTGEDITRLVLTQIIVDDAKEHDSVLPLDILRQMVIATGKASQEGLLKYMRAILEMYQNAYRGFSHVLPPFDWMRMMPGAGADPPAEVNELRRRVEELERMARPSPRARKRGRRKPRRR
ncbi:MAG TPA: polyhydroxyalkanoate synthesis regulator DNA-binding domain-containing protein [Bryobacteraceae bacterium]|nr:polyhydroxyalkanoate synthesis regulator DNA-binding domain-containing protein [Bryobacteraceae bacterium]